MDAPAHTKLLAVTLTAVALGVAACSSLQTAAFTDYETEAQTAVEALERGDIRQFLASAPAYGPSVLLRSPALLLGRVLGGEVDGSYRALAVPALLALAAFALVLWNALWRTDRPKAAWLSLVVVVTSPLIASALHYGHAEEALGASLVAGAAWAAAHDRALLSGVLLGLGLVNKAWAALAVVPILLMLERGRLQALAASGTIAVIGWLPFIVGGSTARHGLQATAQQAGEIFQPWQLWWFLGTHQDRITTYSGQTLIDYRAPPDWVAGFSHPAVVGAPILLAALLVVLRCYRGTKPSVADGLALLTTTFLLRCLLDTWNISYYSLPFLFTLLVWELVTRPRPPVLTTAVAAMLALTTTQTDRWLSPDGQSVAYLLWALPLLLWLLRETLAPNGKPGPDRAPALERWLPDLARLSRERPRS